ncbi:hypothetical protein GCM10009557_91040 [Virgisporangium ochraceum]
MGAVPRDPGTGHLEALAGVLAAGTLAPEIERVHPLAEVPAALEYLGTGHARGKLVVSV